MDQWYIDFVREIGRERASYRYPRAYSLLVSVLIGPSRTYEERVKLGVEIIEAIEAESRATDRDL